MYSNEISFDRRWPRSFRYKLLLPLLLIMLVAFGCDRKRSAGQASLGGENYTNEDWETHETPAFKIQYPPEWILNTSGQMGSLFILYAEERKGQSFVANINLTSEDLPGENITLDRYIQNTRMGLKRMITDISFVYSQRHESDGRKYHVIVYTGKQGMFDLKWKQLIKLKNKKAYILTFTARESNYKKYAGTSDKIMRTFGLKE